MTFLTARARRPACRRQRWLEPPRRLNGTATAADGGAMPRLRAWLTRTLTLTPLLTAAGCSTAPSLADDEIEAQDWPGIAHAKPGMWIRWRCDRGEGTAVTEVMRACVAAGPEGIVVEERDARADGTTVTAFRYGADGSLRAAWRGPLRRGGRRHARRTPRVPRPAHRDVGAVRHCHDHRVAREGAAAIVAARPARDGRQLQRYVLTPAADGLRVDRRGAVARDAGREVAPRQSRWPRSESPIATSRWGKYSRQRRDTSDAVSGSQNSSRG
jgi:hypothetical protein